MKKLLLISLGIVYCSILSAQQMYRSDEWCATVRKNTAPPPENTDLRSDSVDIIHTKIDLNLLNKPQVTAVCSLYLKAKIAGVNRINLDLEGLSVQSAEFDGSPVTYTHVGFSLKIALPALANQGLSDTGLLIIHYQGTPIKDASGWGGVYNQPPYFYNLGVGFAADPHSYGRVWFPCFDNFVERSGMELAILSNSTEPGWSTGYLDSEVVNGTQVTRRWKLAEPIPSYLACFAIGPYTAFKRTYPGVLGPIQVEIAAAVNDTNKVRNTFIRLPAAIACYEHWFGPYKWPKIGYSLVPFNSGAMEHATQIAIMKSAIDGTLNSESLWAHEFSHHWWGDLATCSTAEDMWLNEGWAVFSEHLFVEWNEGKDPYLKAVRDNFRTVLSTSHVNESGYRSVSGVTHDITYGSHTYNKGAVVAHNLRGYMGDSLFRLGIRSALEATSYDDWSSADFRDKLTAATGMNLESFFEDWVFSGGYADFTIDSIKASPLSPLHRKIYVKQKLRGAPHFHNDVPMEFTFVGATGQKAYTTAMVSGENTEVTLVAPFAPKYIFLNTNTKTTPARMDAERNITTLGTQSLGNVALTLSVSTLPDTAFVRVENHWTMPDNTGLANPDNYKMTNRWWSVQGEFPNGFEAIGLIQYDGRGQLDQLDTELFDQTSPSEDSVRLLYRPSAGHPWKEYPFYTRNMLSSSADRYGLLRMSPIMLGEYTIAKGISTVRSKEPTQVLKAKVYPNPAQNTLYVEAAEPIEKLMLIDAAGQVVKEWLLSSVLSSELSLDGITVGKHWLYVQGKKATAVLEVIKL